MAIREIMLDLECTDSARSAAIVSIGAVFFDPKTCTLGKEFYVEIGKHGIQKQMEAGRTLSLDTMIWWLAQSDAARNVWQRNQHEKVDIVAALHRFAQFALSEDTRPRIWGNGVDYDNVVLRDCYETFNIKAPWRYSDNRCYRTIKNLFNKSNTALEREGAHHHALDDAKTQAAHLMKMLKHLNINT